MSNEPAADPAASLPTLQRNALSMLLGKRDFRPHEVAALDRAVLERAPRIGSKGLKLIGEWLRRHGHELAGAPPPARDAEFHRRLRLAKALVVVRQNGYGVVLPEDAG